MRPVVECGQALWRPSSWRRTPECDNPLRYRQLPAGRGFAVGPVIFARRRRPVPKPVWSEEDLLRAASAMHAKALWALESSGGDAREALLGAVATVCADMALLSEGVLTLEDFGV